MIAIVQKNQAGNVTVIVRRGHREETLYGHHVDLRPRDRVEVVRQANNPYLIRVSLARS